MISRMGQWCWMCIHKIAVGKWMCNGVDGTRGRGDDFLWIRKGW
jgi:hypothetical protein